MAAGFSDYFEDKVLGYLFGNVAYSLPGTYYVGLWTSSLSDSSDGSAAGEVSGGSYARVSVTNNSSNWDTASGGATANTNLISFPMATASWGTVTYVGICDASTAGNMIAYAQLTSPVSVSQYDTVIFQPGDLDITLT
ncbi:MAG: phage tail fiber protein [Opitutales bacterium]